MATRAIVRSRRSTASFRSTRSRATRTVRSSIDLCIGPKISSSALRSEFASVTTCADGAAAGGGFGVAAAAAVVVTGAGFGLAAAGGGGFGEGAATGEGAGLAAGGGIEAFFSPASPHASSGGNDSGRSERRIGTVASSGSGSRARRASGTASFVEAARGRMPALAVAGGFGRTGAVTPRSGGAPAAGARGAFAGRPGGAPEP